MLIILLFRDEGALMTMTTAITIERVVMIMIMMIKIQWYLKIIDRLYTIILDVAYI